MAGEAEMGGGMTLQEILDSLEDQARDKDMLADGPDSIFAQDAMALRQAVDILRGACEMGLGGKTGI